MGDLFDEESLERFREMSPREAYNRAKESIYRLGSATSADFVDVFDELVDEGVLTWSQIEELER